MATKCYGEEPSIKRCPPPATCYCAAPMHADVHCIEDSSHEDNSNIDRLPGLEPKLRAALETSQVCRLFQVQANTWKHTGGGLSFDRDLCVSAPTGSGKTLAYAIPIVQALCRQSQLSQLRSLVIVPTGDLAATSRTRFQTSMSGRRP